MRMFAGPNGSGKTTLINSLKDKIHLGVIVNPDEIEKRLRENGFLHFSDFMISVEENTFSNFIARSNLRTKFKGLKFEVNTNILVIKSGRLNSYFSSALSDFIRSELIRKKISFTFETVMSHYSKIEILKSARKSGFRCYLYFVATESPIINIDRVGIRTKKGGHFVSQKKISERYSKSLLLLPEAIGLTNRSFIFDNSFDTMSWIAEVENGINLEFKSDRIPIWFNKVFSEKL